MNEVSASKSALLESPCSLWLHPKAIWERGTNEYASHGTTVHSAIYNAYNGIELSQSERAVADTYVKPAIALLEGLTVGVNPQNVYMEYAICSKIHHSTRLIAGGRASYPKEDGWFCGTADVMIVDGDLLTVLDWKTGNPYMARSQLKTLAGLALDVFTQCNRVRLLSVKVEPGKSFVATDDCLGAEDVSRHLMDIQAKIGFPSYEAKVGTWCTKHYCPHRHNCPELEKVINTPGFPELNMDLNELVPAVKLLRDRLEAAKVHLKLLKG